MGDALPPHFGGYQIEAELGRGGMGVVYRAVDPQLGRRVALKVILGAAEKTERERFHTEAAAAAKLDHPNLVRVYAAGQEQGRPFLALEFVQGESLEDTLRREGPLEPREAVRIMIELARGVQHAHDRGVLHRDIKPDNVLLSDGRPRLTDFGLARLGARNLTQTGVVLGTPQYMSPEQAAGETDQIGPASDVYGLAALLYALLRGAPPFKGDSLVSILMSVMDTPAPRLSEVDPALDAIVQRALAKDPRERTRTADDFAWELQSWLRGSAGSDTRSLLSAPLLGAAGLGVVALVVGAFVLGRSGGGHPPVASATPPSTPPSTPAASTPPGSPAPTASAEGEAKLLARTQALAEDVERGRLKETASKAEGLLERSEAFRLRARLNALLAVCSARLGRWDVAEAAAEAAQREQAADWLTFRCLGHYEIERLQTLTDNDALARGLLHFQRAVAAGDAEPEAHVRAAIWERPLTRESLVKLSREHPCPEATLALARDLAWPATAIKPNWDEAMRLTAQLEAEDPPFSSRARLSYANLLGGYTQAYVNGFAQAWGQRQQTPAFESWFKAQFLPILERVRRHALRALEESPGEPHSYYQAGYALRIQGENLATLARYERALPKIYDWRKESRVLLEEARRLVQRGRDLFPDHYRLGMELVDCTLALDGPRPALLALDPVLKRYPERWEAHYLRYKALIQLYQSGGGASDLTQALGTLDDVLRLVPHRKEIARMRERLRAHAAEKGIPIPR